MGLFGAIINDIVCNLIFYLLLLYRIQLIFKQFYLFIYFIFDCAGSLLPHVGSLKLWQIVEAALSCVSRFLIVEAALVEHEPQGTRASVVAAHGLSSCGSWALERRFRSVAHRLSCPTARGIFNQGSDSCLLHWQTDSLPLSHQGSPTIDFCMLILFPA